MYQDQDSIKIFERLHARDRAAELARKLGDAPSNDLDIFAAHARVEARDDVVSIGLSVLILAAVLAGAIALFWK